MTLGFEPLIHSTAQVKDSRLGSYISIGRYCSIQETEIGDYSYCSEGDDIIYAGIGKFVSIASQVRINPGQHPAYTRIAQNHFTYRCAQYGFGEDDETFFQWRRNNRVVIGNDVWIGYNATVMGGVTVGNGAVIGSMAVVTKDVKPYQIVAGIPARPIKYRFTPEIIEAIEKSCWWEWEHEVLRQRLKEFSDIQLFCEKYGK